MRSFKPTTWIGTQITYLAPVHDNSRKVAEEAQRPPELLPNRTVTNLGSGGGCVSDGSYTKLQMDWSEEIARSRICDLKWWRPAVMGDRNVGE
jgi:hypothetical protein